MHPKLMGIGCKRGGSQGGHNFPQNSNQPNEGTDLIAKAMKILMCRQLQRGVTEAGGGGVVGPEKKPYGNAKA
jgi:hypothetical protein